MPESLRLILQQHAPWPISFHDFNGERIKPTFGKKNLLDDIIRRERFVCDSNSYWKREAGKKKNQHKAFIIPHTALDEPDDVSGNLFGNKVDFSNENIYFFTAAPYQGGLCLAIELYNSQFLKRFDPKKLKEASRERMEKTDVEYLKSEAEQMAQVRDEKKNILSFLELANVEDLPPVEVLERKKADLIRYIHSVAPRCFKDYRRAMNVAGQCFATLLLEQDDVGQKTRKEFNDTNRRNVFGDTLLFRDALWFKARILSNDRALTRMAEYGGLPEIKVVGVV